MPQIKVERIVSFTSEDPTYTANNILSSKKWKCKTAGEKSASLVLQLDQPYIINGIDIGNENSAYIEVLVSRSSAPEDFKVLLVMSSFMTPVEARQTQNVNKVRMFKSDDLSDTVRNEKWDRIKVVCTQPFNRHVQYGLSFINLYSSSDGGNGGDSTNQPKHIGNFVIRPASPDNLSAGSLFARRKQLLPDKSSDPAPLKGAAAIREATALAHSGSPLSKQKVKLNLTAATVKNNKDIKEDEASTSNKEKKERNRNELLYNKDEEDKHDKIDKLIEKRDEEKAEASKRLDKDRDKDTPSKARDSKKEQTLMTKRGNDNKPINKDTPMKRKHGSSDSKQNTINKKPKKESKGKPFARLLEDVVLVISGIQNPDRASLRSMALSMGARYKADWDDTCTHLICAFSSTPKFNQVKGRGKIVKKRWLEACYNGRKKLPWRRFALDKADQGPESDEEICEEESSPKPAAAETYGIDSDDDDDTRAQGSDTDDRIAEIRQKQNKTTNNEDTAVFNVDTDEDISDSTNINSPSTTPEIKHKFKNFFQEKMFYVDENLDDEMQKNIKQYIAAYNGLLVENLEVSIDIIVTNGDDYKVLKDLYPTAICVAPDWIWECHNCQKLMPMKDFIYE